MMNKSTALIIAIDGPSGVGKGTLCQFVARHLKFHYLDSGALYRIVGLAAYQANIELNNAQKVTNLANTLDIRFTLPETGDTQVYLNHENVTDLIRTEEAGGRASQVALHTGVRDALLELQRNKAQVPGLVADGRDMGTEVFPHAACKIFLTASAEERADRRYNQLKAKGNSVSLPRLLEDIKQRDERDANRSASPLRPAEDAQVIDTTHLTIQEVEQVVITLLTAKGIT